MFRIILALFFLSCSFQVSAQKTKKIKNGRHYIKYLALALDIQSYELGPLYKSLKPNLPKNGTLDEFYPSKDSLAKIADYMCGVVNFMEGESLDIDYLYKNILGRKATALEKETQLMNDGKFHFYSNCFVLALHPEVIFDSRSK